jgi:hypothetical protein
MNKVTINLSIDEANLVLEALGDMPYRRVYELVVKIQQQASEQLNENQDKKESQNLNAVPNSDSDMAKAV